MLLNQPLEGVRLRRSHYNAATGLATTDFQVTTDVAKALTAKLGAHETISLPQSWGAPAAVIWPGQRRRTRVRVVNVPAELQSTDIKLLLTAAGCNVETSEPAIDPHYSALTNFKVPRTSAVEVVLADGLKVPSVLKCDQYPSQIMRLDIITLPAPLCPIPNGVPAASPRTFAAAVASSPSQSWPAPRPRQQTGNQGRAAPQRPQGRRRQAPQAASSSRLGHAPTVQGQPQGQPSQRQPTQGQPGQEPPGQGHPPQVGLASGQPGQGQPTQEDTTPEQLPAQSAEEQLPIAQPTPDPVPIMEAAMSSAPLAPAQPPPSEAEPKEDGELPQNTAAPLQASPTEDGFQTVKARTTRNRAAHLSRNTRAGGRTQPS